MRAAVATREVRRVCTAADACAAASVAAASPGAKPGTEAAVRRGEAGRGKAATAVPDSATATAGAARLALHHRKGGEHEVVEGEDHGEAGADVEGRHLPVEALVHRLGDLDLDEADVREARHDRRETGRHGEPDHVEVELAVAQLQAVHLEPCEELHLPGGEHRAALVAWP